MISKSLAIEVLNAGLATGADFAEIYLEDTKTSTISVENGKVETSATTVSKGAGIRLLKDLRSVYGYTSDLSKKSLLKLAFDLSKSFQGERILTVEKLKTIKVKNLSNYERSLFATPKEDIITVLKKGDKVMKEYDKRILRTNSGLGMVMKDVEIFNSRGKHFKDHKERGRAFLSCVAIEGDKVESGYNAPGARRGFEFFDTQIDIEALAKDAARAAILMLTAKDCPSGKMPVILGNGFGGVLFHEACGHPLEASAVSKKLSVFSESLGKQIASPIVSAVDDGTIPNAWGSNNIDDEGNPTQKNQLIKDGICVGYLIDDFNGRRMGMKGNGACRRQNYKYEPTSRMSNTYIENGTSTVEDIIKSTKLGLYAVSLGGGQVSPATGEFNFSCSEAYIVRDGKVCEAVRGATLIGKGEEILLKIDMIANDLERSQGMCGAASGSIPVEVGQPTLRISEMTVGGTGGELK